MSVRELVAMIISLLGAYILWLTVRFVRLGRKNVPSAIESSTVLPPLHPSPASIAEKYATGADATDDESLDAQERYTPADEPPTEVLLESSAPDDTRSDYEAWVEIRQLRYAVENLRNELEIVRAAHQQLQQQVEELQAARYVSPQYNEAVALAQRGFDADAIAERCSISVSEAELVIGISQFRRND